MKKKKILWDMDGCKTQLIPPVLAYLNGKFAGLNLAIEDVKVWNFSDNPEISRAALEYIAEPGFFRNLEPCLGSIEAFNEMVWMGHEVVICTTPLPGDHRIRCMEEKRAWIIEHLGKTAAETVVFSDNKTEIESDVIIDDKPHLTVGQACIRFKHWLIVDHPYNRSLPKMEHYPVGRINGDWSNWREEFAKLGLI